MKYIINRKSKKTLSEILDCCKNNDNIKRERKTKSYTEKNFIESIDPNLRSNPAVDTKKLSEVLKNSNFISAIKDILENVISNRGSNLRETNNLTESEKLDESMENYLKYIYSQNKIATIKMIKDKTLDKLVKQYKKDQKDKKIINDNLENKQIIDKNHYSKMKIKKNEVHFNNVNYGNKLKSKKISSFDSFGDQNTKTYFNATNIIARNSKLIDIQDNLKRYKNNHDNYNNFNQTNYKFFENKSKNLFSNKLDKSIESSSINNSSIQKSANSPIKLKPSTSHIKKLDNSKKILNINKRESNYNFPDKFIEKNNKNQKNSNASQTRGSIFRGTKINPNNFQSRNNFIQQTFTKFKNTLSNNDNSFDYGQDVNPLLLNMNLNNLLKKDLNDENFSKEKFDNLKKIAFTNLKNLKGNKINYHLRYNQERDIDYENSEEDKNLDTSEEKDLNEINNELRNSFIKITINDFKNNSDKDNKFHNSKERKSINKNKNKSKSKKDIKVKNNNIRFSNKDNNGAFSSNEESENKMEDLAKAVVEKCKFGTKKHKNNDTRIVSGNGKLMITSGLSLNEFMKKFNLK